MKALSKFTKAVLIRRIKVDSACIERLELENAKLKTQLEFKDKVIKEIISPYRQYIKIHFIGYEDIDTAIAKIINDAEKVVKP